MTCIEADNLFDTLYNNIMSNQSPGLNLYEKSLFLTKAQDEIIKSYFNASYNKSGQGFDDSPKRQVDFSTLIQTYTTAPKSVSGGAKVDSRSYLYDFPSNAIAIINEEVAVSPSDSTGSIYLQVIPLRYDEYIKLMSKPYKWPLKHLAWRLISNNSSWGGLTVEIVARPVFYPTGGAGTIGNYIVRYVKKPGPIILTNLSDTPDLLSIEGIKTQSAYTFGTLTNQMSELNPELHEEIVQRAVELAKAAYTGDLSSQIILGHSSETEKGVITQQR